MSLRDVGGEEECFEYDCWDEERKSTCERQDSLDSLEEGKFCAFLLFDPFSVNVNRLDCSDFTTLLYIFFNLRY